MNINMELYRTFYCVAKVGSISKAADLLFVTQPAVSRAIQQLEEKLGMVLFFRTPKGVRLTKDGELLYPYVEQAFNFISLGERTLLEVKELHSGEISIGAGDTVCKHYLPGHLKDFKRTYPGIGIHVTNQSTQSVINMLKKGSIDMGFVHLPVVDEQLMVYKIMEIQDCFVVGEKYKELAMKPRTAQEIAKYPLILLEKGGSSRTYIEKMFSKYDLTVKPAFELSDFELNIQFALIDFGVAAVIKNFIVEELENQSLYEVKLIDPIPPRYIGLVHLKTVPLPAAAKKFLSFLLEKPSSDDQ
ncbi:LysR family transcriptional regulator [Heliorestis acidaminivorans]|uniref:LysR family transcriptional regulator n=1 Tax=Heliorestis acidaminivorans TaxID=553427 RepID=A0A6I0F0L9_9FIRM|nr:LysR family transcriptional regulator [Heliorestis acidaminivorans]KAB2953426.1 LysR family transcriptional regulator [Heliorestis acidaminivorans]